MGESRGVFLYPSLLPDSAMNVDVFYKKRDRISWVDAEDQLIAMGLQRFAEKHHAGDAKERVDFTKAKMGQACQDMVDRKLIRPPVKTAEMIRKRVKNQRGRKKNEEFHPIIFWEKCAEAPKLSLDYSRTDFVLDPNSKLKNADPDAFSDKWKRLLQLKVANPSKKTRKELVDIAPSLSNVPGSSSPTRTAEVTEVTEEVTVPITSSEVPKENNVLVTFSYSPSKETVQIVDMPDIGTPKKKSPLKKERDRLLRKYSPIKMKQRKLLPKSSNNVQQQQQQQQPEEAEETAMDVVESEEAPVLPPNEEVAPKKKPTKQQKEAEITLALLDEETKEEENARKVKEATDLIKFAQRELDAHKFVEFIDILSKSKEPVLAASFQQLHKLCQGCVEIQDMLLDMLTAEAALSLGMPVYDQFRMRNDHKKFFRKVRKFYENQPSSAYNRVLKEISSALSSEDFNEDTIKNLASKLFKGNQYLHDAFLALLPQAPCPDSMLPEPEFINLDDEDDETATGEKIDLPASHDDDYGGENCKCRCHVGQERGKVEDGIHCLHCSLVFIDGKVYIKEGKILKLARVEYPVDGGENSSNVADEPLFGEKDKKSNVTKKAEKKLH